MTLRATPARCLAPYALTLTYRVRSVARRGNQAHWMLLSLTYHRRPVPLRFTLDKYKERKKGSHMSDSIIIKRIANIVSDCFYDELLKGHLNMQTKHCTSKRNSWGCGRFSGLGALFAFPIITHLLIDVLNLVD